MSDEGAEALDTAPRPGVPHGGTPEVADGVDRRLDPRFIPLRRTALWIFTGCVAAGSLVLLLITWLGSGPAYPLSGLVPAAALPPPLADLLVRTGLWTAGVGLLAWRAHRWPVVEYHHLSYRIDELGIEIRRGVFWRAIINVPRSRVQHTDVSQGPLERRFGLGTLVIYTAGTDHARVSLGGLEHVRALRIREHLLPGTDSDAV